MFRFLDTLRTAPIPARERVAFVAALAVTLGIGAAWLSFSFGAPQEPAARRIARATPPSATPAPADATEGPLMRLRAEVADAAVAIAAEVGNLTNLWKSRLFPPPLQFERADAPEQAPSVE